jgi:hypothetical protein
MTDMTNKALLIDPFQQAISIVDYEYGGSYKQISRLISTEEVTMPLFATVDIDGENTLYVDDEGLYREDQRSFTWEGYPYPLTGKALILGTDYDTGDSVPPTLTLDQVAAAVSYPFPHTVVQPDFTVLTFNSAAEFDAFIKTPLGLIGPDGVYTEDK